YVAYRRGFRALLLLAVAGSILLYAGWGAAFLTETPSLISLVAAAILGAIFVLPEAFGIDSSEAKKPENRRSQIARPVPPAVGLVGPFGGGISVGASTELAVPPAILVPYLLILSLGTTLAALRTDLHFLPPVAAVLTLLPLVGRIANDLFPIHRTA